jgi:beta-galactosidase
MEVPHGVELTVRTAGGKQWIFLLNHTAEAQTVRLAKSFTDVLSKETLTGKASLEAYGVRILQA